MDLNELLAFARVAQHGSFTRAAKELGMPKSTLSRRISALEERLGARLLQRTTRRLSLTDVGAAYFEHAERALAAADDAERAVTQLQSVPRGLLRVTGPLSFQFLGPIVADFLSQFPEVQVEFVCTDRVVHLVEEGFDAAIRAGALADSSLIARPLGYLRNYLVASPAYVARRGPPSAPSELSAHDCLAFGAGTDRLRWHLRANDQHTEVTIKPRLTVNDTDMLYDAACAGLGIALLPGVRGAEALASGRLVRLLEPWSSRNVPVQVVYPSARNLSPKVRAFVHHLQSRWIDVA